MATKTKNVGKNQIMVRLDQASKATLAQAAQLRRISLSDYVRLVVVVQAQREVKEASSNIIGLTADEQSAFWTALNAEPKLTESQRELGAIMRGAK